MMDQGVVIEMQGIKFFDTFVYLGVKNMPLFFSILSSSFLCISSDIELWLRIPIMVHFDSFKYHPLSHRDCSIRYLM